MAMDMEPGNDEASMPAEAVVHVATHTNSGIAENSSPKLTSTTPALPYSLAVTSDSGFQINHGDDDTAASHSDTLKTVPQSVSQTGEPNFEDMAMACAADHLPAKQTLSDRHAPTQAPENIDTNSSKPPPDDMDEHLTSHASRKKKTTKQKPKPAEARKKARRGQGKPAKQEKQDTQQGREERKIYCQKLRRDLAGDGDVVQENQDDKLEDLKEDLKICEGDLSKLNRAQKQGPLSDHQLQEMDELRKNIANLQKEIEELSKKPAAKTARVKNAREFWERWHADGPKENLALAKKITGNKRKRAKDINQTLPAGKKRKCGKTVTWNENYAGDNDDVQDSRQALAKSLGMQDQGEISLVNKTKLFKQLTSKKVTRSGADPRAKDQVQVLQHATSSFGFKVCKLEEEKNNTAFNLFRWEIHDFKSQLYNHQVVGVSWMLRREFSPLPPHGGILSDAMGLGKTVQILACMAHNPPLPQEYPEDDEHKTRATLIIAPASAINQWRSEIDVHTSFKPVFIYKKTGTVSMDRSLWMKTKIVLASYEEVVGALPPKSALDAANGELSDVDPSLVGDLFKVEFHRIVADEAHKMKNHNSRTSIACSYLRAKYRWAVTGTPILNRLEELYAFLRFLKIEPDSTFEDFKKKFHIKGKGRPKKNEKLTEEQKEKIAALLQKEQKKMIATLRDEIMLRRTANEFFLGSPILNIPDIAESKDEILEMSSEEAIIIKYHQEGFCQMVDDLVDQDSGEVSTQNKEEDDSSQATKQKRGYMLSRINHMRQLAAHLFLGDQLIRTFWQKDAFEKVIPLLPQSSNMTNSVLHNQLKKYHRKAEQESEASLDATTGLDTCGSCDELPIKAHTTACNHIFCYDCVTENSNMYAEIADIPCPVCAEEVGKLVPVKTYGQGPSQNKYPNASRGQRNKTKQEKKPREYGEDLNGVRLQSNKPNGFLQLNDIYQKNQREGRAGVGESSKLNATLKYIRKWQAEAPDDKIIVFTQWVAFGMILGRRLQEEDIGFCYFFGTMGMDTRNKAVSIFKDDPNAKVLIAGFSCTGVALNLTCANRVIHIDLWWNKGLEDQANGRVLRIGQTKETYFVRLLLKDTWDEIIKDLQDDKTEECAPFMDDEKALCKAQQITHKQMLSFFRYVAKVDGSPAKVDGGRAKTVRKSGPKADESEEEEMTDTDETDDDTDNIWEGPDGDYKEDNDESSRNDESSTSDED